MVYAFLLLSIAFAVYSAKDGPMQYMSFPHLKGLLWIP